MKKAFLFCICLFLASGLLHAEKISDVTLRYSQEENRIRVVLGSDTDTIRELNSIVTLAGIKIEFPYHFTFKKQVGFMFRVVREGRFLTIEPEDVMDARVFKLTAPPRLVIDLELKTEKQPEPVRRESHVVTEPAPLREESADLNVDQPVPASDYVKVVVLDPGHGGYDYGIVAGDAKEKDVNLKLSNALSTGLSRKGKKVYLTRKADQSLPIHERIRLANEQKPDVFLGIHSSLTDKFVLYISSVNDRNEDTVAKLYSVSLRQLRYIEKSKELANALAASVKKKLGMNATIRELPLPVLNSMDSPAVLIEYPSMKFNSYEEKMQNTFVKMILDGLTAYEQ